MFEDSKYRIMVVISPYSESLVKELANDVPKISTTNEIKLNQEVGLVLTVSPSSNIDNANLIYSVSMKLPNGEITPPSIYVLRTGELEKGAIYSIQGQMYTIMANEPSDCGAYQFIIDIFDNGKKLKRFLMDFSIVE